MNTLYHYPGSELSLFEKAENWKKYFASCLAPYIKGDVLEIGAGLGANTTFLNRGSHRLWVLLEPDQSMTGLLKGKIADRKLPGNCSVVTGTIRDISNVFFDTIIYIDVLEHIEKDSEELACAASLLKPDGHIIVLSPAFLFLFSPFDKAIGHYRRYTKKKIKTIIPPSLLTEKVTYLDTVGFFASAANRILLRQSSPTAKQIHLWDKWMIPVSKFTDRVFFYSFGKSILAIFKKNPGLHG